jgi:dTDP-4-dehydrorhamnose reductase
VKALLFGPNGQVGAEIRRRAAAHGASVVAIDRVQCDFDDPQADFRAWLAARPDCVINAAAYTAVDKAESDGERARRVNAAAPGRLAAACAEAGRPLIHFSTDYVFDGMARSPYRENDPTGPLNVYGATKLEGDQKIAASGAAFAIFRLSWVFSAHGANFVKAMLRLGREKPSLRVVCDQRGKPTPAAAAADAALAVAKRLASRRAESGVYHFAGDSDTNWAAFAEEIFGQARMNVAVERIGAADYPTAARRPAYSVLDTTKYERAFGAAAPDWREHLAQVLAELSAAETLR